MAKPSVTQIIGTFNPSKDFMNNEQALINGRNVHKMTRLYDKGILNKEKLDVVSVCYLDGYKKFLEDFEPKYTSIEKRGENNSYTGGWDRVGIIHAKQSKLYQQRFVMDIKTGGLQKGALGLQLAAYANLLNWEIDLGYGLQLKAGAYSLAFYPKKLLRQYFIYFTSMLNCYNFIEQGYKIN